MSANSKNDTLEARAGSLAARAYSMGKLREPDLSPRASDDLKRHVMLVYPMAAGAGGEYIDACNSPKFGVSYFSLNSNLPKAHRSDIVMHEVFHGVQAMYPWHKVIGTKCPYIPNWIVEGTVYGSTGVVDRSSDPAFHGLRRYDLPLFHASCMGNLHQGDLQSREQASRQRVVAPPNLLGCYTSSFWRFLMERISGVRSPNYDAKALEVLGRYMLGKPPTKRTSDQQWLDWGAAHTTAMLSHFHYIYAEFVTEFASWP